MSEIEIHISDRQSLLPAPDGRLREAIQRVLESEQIHSAEISLVLVDDAAIQQINRDYLGHDYPTDVISFTLGSDDAEAVADRAASDRPLEGELVVSVETAIREASSHGWSPADELLLYVVHGMLHLCGYDDLTDEARPIMRVRERQVLAHWKLVPTGLEA